MLEFFFRIIYLRPPTFGLAPFGAFVTFGAVALAWAFLAAAEAAGVGFFVVALAFLTSLAALK